MYSLHHIPNLVYMCASKGGLGPHRKKNQKKKPKKKKKTTPSPHGKYQFGSLKNQRFVTRGLALRNRGPVRRKGLRKHSVQHLRLAREGIVSPFFLVCCSLFPVPCSLFPVPTRPQPPGHHSFLVRGKMWDRGLDTGWVRGMGEVGEHEKKKRRSLCGDECWPCTPCCRGCDRGAQVGSQEHFPSFPHRVLVPCSSASAFRVRIGHGGNWLHA
ncbi:hypothetical protein F5X96DRAFT_195643 [Biscogniauxia mediterranea]|nr:hypothetical protein F5X96DRAFT_195643 [Biscogniauxia mediterranea]